MSISVLFLNFIILITGMPHGRGKRKKGCTGVPGIKGDMTILILYYCLALKETRSLILNCYYHVVVAYEIEHIRIINTSCR